MVLTPSAMVALGTPAPDFVLPDTEGNVVRRSDFAGQPLLVMFICNHCPYVQHIRNALSNVTAQIIDKGVAVVGINSNDVDAYPDDSPANMAIERAEQGYEFPYLFDATQDVARSFSATCTPDFFLYDADHKLAYRGQFDDSRPGNGVPVSGEDLAVAVDAMIAGHHIDNQIPSIGCNIKWRP